MSTILTRGRPIGFPEPGQTVAVAWNGEFILDEIETVYEYNSGYGRSIKTKHTRQLSFRYYWEPIYKELHDGRYE